MTKNNLSKYGISNRIFWRWIIYTCLVGDFELLLAFERGKAWSFAPWVYWEVHLLVWEFDQVYLFRLKIPMLHWWSGCNYDRQYDIFQEYIYVTDRLGTIRTLLLEFKFHLIQLFQLVFHREFIRAYHERFHLQSNTPCRTPLARSDRLHQPADPKTSYSCF